jgi:type VI secretion system protein ImpC
MAENNPQAQPQGTPSAAAAEVSEFESLLKKEFKPKTDERRSAIRTAVQTLAEQALAATTLISDDAVKTIEAIIAEIDRKLSQQMNLILHHDNFKSLEGTWRGLHHFVTNTETDEKLKIRVFNISKKELSRAIKKYKGVAWDQSPLFKKVYEAEYGTLNGQPYGVLVGDYYFDHSAPDVEILSGVAQIAAAAHAPFISAAAPNLLGLESWQDLGNPRDLTKTVQTPEYAAWKSLRSSADAMYLGLTLPRFLARLPYGAKNNPVEEFDFEEDAEGPDHSKYVWSNASYAMATNITRAFKLYGWCTQIRGIESGGTVEGLPVHTFPTDDGGVDMKCPTEYGIPWRREAELSKNGFMPLVHAKNADYAAFMGAQSLYQPKAYDDPDATANENLSARLPYMFAICRFAHYLDKMVYEKVGTFKERGDVEDWLNKWIAHYVVTDPNASDEVKAEYPLASAEVKVEEIEGNPGYYKATFALRPHYQLEGINVSLRLVSKLPSVKKGS